MPADRPGHLNVVLCWHMHQPDYRRGGVFLRPWTWLHAIKDYSDMAAHLEALPLARAVVNFSPVLIEQLQDYTRRMQSFLTRGEAVGDLILDALAGHAGARNDPSLLPALLRVNEPRVNARFVPYARLYALAQSAIEQGATLAEQDLDDLLVWYVLAWLGESVRGEPVAVSLAAREKHFTASDRRTLFDLLTRTIAGLIPRYRALAEQDRIELSVTPYSHPILPLIEDLACAREALPRVLLPGVAYPGGTERCEWQLTEACRVFRQAFGFDPAGCWPSEGAISESTLRLLSCNGFRWVASGEKVLRNSLARENRTEVALPQLQPWSLAETDGLSQAGVTCFFRDDGLSDLIGFEYSKWTAEAAVEDFIRRVEQLYIASEGKPAVLSIIMDGENAWEYFDRNGWDFLHGMYQRLSTHPRLRLTTFAAVCDPARHLVQARPLHALCAGSWVYGNFSTWIGDPAKNRAWELLSRAKAAVNAALLFEREESERDGGQLPEWVTEVMHQLAVCEASDWFWWLGADNRLVDGPAFDLLFRQQLAELYRLIGMMPPAILDHPINAVLQGAPAVTQGAGAMRQA